MAASCCSGSPFTPGVGANGFVPLAILGCFLAARVRAERVLKKSIAIAAFSELLLLNPQIQQVTLFQSPQSKGAADP